MISLDNTSKEKIINYLFVLTGFVMLSRSPGELLAVFSFIKPGDYFKYTALTLFHEIMHDLKIFFSA